MKINPAETIRGYFETDHDRLDGLFKTFQEEKHQNFEKAQEAFEKFKTDLERHILWEEEILFPIFEEKTGIRDVGPTVVMRMEHRMIKDVLEAILQKVQRKNSDTDAEEAALLSHLMQHNQKEENILYPQIDRLVNDEEKTGVFKKIEESLSY